MLTVLVKGSPGVGLRNSPLICSHASCLLTLLKCSLGCGWFEASFGEIILKKGTWPDRVKNDILKGRLQQSSTCVLAAIVSVSTTDSECTCRMGLHSHPGFHHDCVSGHRCICQCLGLP